MKDWDWTIARLRAAIVAKEVKAADICDHFLKRISTLAPELNAFTAVFEETARARAEEIDRQPDTWRDQPLLGVPVAVKDVICTRGTHTTGALEFCRDFVRPMTPQSLSAYRTPGPLS
jgi:aspartyl-tRNA(Asn)/glutamyl-tRNA(Gln) amidotransferase subunit A